VKLRLFRGLDAEPEPALAALSLLDGSAGFSARWRLASNADMPIQHLDSFKGA
jgi:hypothetical protein